MVERDIERLQALIEAKAVAGVELLLEDACERWEIEAARAIEAGERDRADYLSRKLARGKDLVAEIRALAHEAAREAQREEREDRE
ncbi:MAG TPA: hypothetical protein VGW38_17065 [Chloroflexota bacterium]|nr:hypothetical protein [Chloroflexota bacterium]